jgi:hypothetical protein
MDSEQVETLHVADLRLEISKFFLKGLFA